LYRLTVDPTAPDRELLRLLYASLVSPPCYFASSLRIDPGHDVPDGTVLAGSVHPLKNQQQRIAVGRVVKALQRAQLFNVFSQEFLIPLLRLAKGIHNRRPLPEFDRFSGPNTGILLIDFHLHPFGVTSCVGCA